MDKNKVLILVFVLLAIGVAGGFYFMKMDKETPVEDPNMPELYGPEVMPLDMIDNMPPMPDPMPPMPDPMPPMEDMNMPPMPDMNMPETDLEILPMEN